MRYKCWRSRKDSSLHLLCAEGDEAFDALPDVVRHLGPWTGGAEGDVDRLRLAHRLMLTEQGFAVIYAHVSKLGLEPAARASCTQLIPNAPNAKARGVYRCTMVCGIRNARGWGCERLQGPDGNAATRKRSAMCQFLP